MGGSASSDKKKGAFCDASFYRQKQPKQWSSINDQRFRLPFFSSDDDIIEKEAYVIPSFATDMTNVLYRCTREMLVVNIIGQKYMMSGILFEADCMSPVPRAKFLLKLKKNVWSECLLSFPFAVE